MGLCFAVLFGGASGPTSILYIVSVNPAAVGEALVTDAGLGNNVTNELFNNIPDFYQVGISGTHRLYPRILLLHINSLPPTQQQLIRSTPN
jgi:hypothetical protein